MIKHCILLLHCKFKSQIFISKKLCVSQRGRAQSRCRRELDTVVSTHGRRPCHTGGFGLDNWWTGRSPFQTVRDMSQYGWLRWTKSRSTTGTRPTNHHRNSCLFRLCHEVRLFPIYALSPCTRPFLLAKAHTSLPLQLLQPLHPPRPTNSGPVSNVRPVHWHSGSPSDSKSQRV